MEMHQEHPQPQPFPHPGNCSSSSPWPAVDAAVNHHPHHSYHHDPNHPAVQNYPPDPNHPIHQNYPPGPNAHQNYPPDPNAHQNFHHDPSYHAHQNYQQDPNYHAHHSYQQDFNHQAHQSYQQDFNHHAHQSYQQDSNHHGPQSYHQGPNHFDHHQHHHGNHSNGSFPPVPFPVRKRPWQGPLPQDHFEGPSYVKLYAAQVSRAPNEESIRHVFEQYGTVVEVFILRNKTTGQLQGSCFVKYATIDEADRAIRALNNQHYFPGEALPMIVRYADGEKERLGLSDKLYVNGLNKEASTKEVLEIFEPYGYIEDLHLLRDEMRQNRGSGFVRFSSRDMALSAIKALNGTFIMRGCMRPLLVRFADPKKPGGIESRGHYAFSSKNIGTHPQEPVRLVSDHGDSIGGFPMHNAPHPVQQASHPPSYQLPNQEPQASSGIQVKPPFPPSKLGRMPPQPAQNTQRGSQSSRVEANETHMQHLTQPSGLIIGQQQSSQTVASSSASPTVPSSHEMAALVECDWSEHTCPDGHKYYYNCETCESRWEKPVELSLCEQQLQTHTQLQNPSHNLQALPSALCTQHSAQTQQVQIQTHAFNQPLQLQKPSIHALEPDHLQTQPETSPVVAPTCV